MVCKFRARASCPILWFIFANGKRPYKSSVSQRKISYDKETKRAELKSYTLNSSTEQCNRIWWQVVIEFDIIIFKTRNFPDRTFGF